MFIRSATVLSSLTAGRCSAWCRVYFGKNGCPRTTKTASRWGFGACSLRPATCPTVRRGRTSSLTPASAIDAASGLAEHNIKPTDIDIVILTHLHFDHSGGNTFFQNNMLTPTFPKARYIVQKAEWEKAVNPNERTRASYIKDNLIPIKEAGQLELLDGNGEILPGISVRVTGGHTRGHQIVLIESGNKKAVYWSDLIPTTAHIDLPYIMGYDLYPEETLEEKRRLVEQAIKEEWICFWEHDPVINCGYIRKDADGKLTVEPLV